METLGIRLKKLRKEKKLTQQQLADVVGVSKTSVIYWEKDENLPKHESLMALAKALDSTPNWLLNGGTDTSNAEKVAAFIDGIPSVITHDDLAQEERDQKIWINMYNVRFCSGDGESIEFHFDEIKKQLSFEPDFFRKRNIKSQNFKLIMNKGDSNEEYLFDGDAVGIDTSDTEIMDGETYAIYFEKEALIRQIFKEQGGVLTLHPRNKAYKDKTVTPLYDDSYGNQFKVFGRVRYRSG
ncbi:hypothetical protein F900_01029 [Acinetobacter modestus]|uniref:HTH cro/C1-type domain-containing protein n=1 Tax=Acinetobacter modestus TaxID=1776740 RepID=N9M239_9GAMM|nr:helix-turn-helix domain-containing protein [Acinetobacter modestus]ENX02583.1 hypothetical protein F900_01029 [Acinetobacter modestus]